jgi:hypothetical protein
MPDSRAVEILDHQQQLENQRSNWDSHWQEVAELCLPRHDEFNKKQSEGEKRTERIFDSTALLAVDRAASAIDSLVTPSTQFYHRLEPMDERLVDDLEIRRYLDEVNKVLFRMRYRPTANFSSQAHECYVSLVAFGNDCLFTDDVLGIGLRYKSCSMSEIYIAENAAGIIDLVHRKFPLTARQAVQKFGNSLPAKILETADKKPFDKFDFLHRVAPNEEMRVGMRDFRGMQFMSYYIAYEGKTMLSEGGYRTFPYAVGRHVTAPTETYGRGPAMMVLPDIKMINEMEKTMIRAAHKIVDPPLLLHGDGILSVFNARPNALNYGGVDEQGRQLVHPLKVGSNLPVGFEMADKKREVINDAFMITLFQILVRNPQMTATEALIRAQEKGQLLAPTVGRQQAEFMGNVVTRELDIASAAGIFPPMPQKLRATGGEVKVVYTSPLSRLRRAEDGTAIMRTLEMISGYAEAKPEILDNFDEDVLVRELADINGVPAKILRTEDVVRQIREMRIKQQAEQAQIQNQDVQARTAKNAAQAAQAVGIQAPQQVQ